ncbi:MAG: protein phosphatase 2C domain-containing protein [Rubripirellula sp.]
MDAEGFDVAGASDVGQKRTENQDHFLVANLRRQLVVEQTNVASKRQAELFGCQEGKLLVVADGMGGHVGGEKASRTAVEACARYVLDMMQWFLKLSPGNEQDFEQELSECLKVVQRNIWSDSGAEVRRMGTTVTMAYVLWPRMFVVHAGDSRCYLLRDGSLKQLTTDHTIAQQLVESGGLAPEDAANSSWRHVLWNCVGGGKAQVQPEAMRCNLRHDDVIFLCSDGLTGMVDESEVVSIITAAASSDAATKKLIDAANDAGGTGNISVIVCRIGRPDDCGEKSTPGSTTTTIG